MEYIMIACFSIIAGALVLGFFMNDDEGKK